MGKATLQKENDLGMKMNICLRLLPSLRTHFHYSMHLTNSQGEYLDLRQKKQQITDNDTTRSIIIYIQYLTLFR